MIASTKAARRPRVDDRRVPTLISRTGDTRDGAMIETRDAIGSEPTAPDAFAPGRSVGRYIISQRLGSGGMGSVYAAYDPKLDRRLAIKVLHDPSGPSWTGSEIDHLPQQQLLQEAHGMAQLDHPNVLTVYDVGTVDGRVFMAMELNRGGDLRQWATRDRRRWSEVVDVMLAAGEGLAYAHDHGLVHRDIKPDNLLLDCDGRVRIADFGLAHAEIVRPRVVKQSDDLGSTQTSIRDGTPGYMAPEQHLGTAVDALSDQYAFCVSFYELLAGVRPYMARDREALVEAIARGQPLSPLAGRRVPSWLVRAVARGLAFDANSRYADMRTLLEALRAGLRTRRRRGQVLRGLGLWLGLGGTGIASSVAASDDPCERGQTAEGEIWTAERARNVRDAFIATGVDVASSSFESIASLMDRRSRQWTESRTSLCRSHREAASVTNLDAAQQCLEVRRSELEALVSVFQEADASVVARATSSVDALAEPSICMDSERYVSRFPLPNRPAQSAEVSRLRARIATAETLGHAARIPPALALSEEVLREAESVDFAPLVAEARMNLGLMQMLDAQVDRSRENLERALHLAESLGHDEVAARSATALVYILGPMLKRPEEALRVAEHARAHVHRARDRADLLAEWLNNSAATLGLLDRHDESEQRYLEALELHGEGERTSALTRAERYNNLAIARLGQYDYEGAARLYAQAVDMGRQQLGPRHPKIVFPLMNLGSLSMDMGRPGEGLRYAREADDIYRTAFGNDSAQRSWTCPSLARALAITGWNDEGRRIIAECIAIDRASRGGQPELLELDILQASMTISGGDYVRGRDRHRALRERLAQPERAALDPSTQAWDAVSVGQLAMALHDFEAAECSFDRALTGGKTITTAQQLQGFIRLNRADIALARGDADAALSIYIPYLDRLRAAGHDRDPLLWYTRIRASRALRWKERHDEAQTLLTEARRDLKRELGEDHHFFALVEREASHLAFARGDVATAIRTMERARARFSALDQDRWLEVRLDLELARLLEAAATQPARTTALRSRARERLQGVRWDQVHPRYRDLPELLAAGAIRRAL